ncbi:MAG: hypothetical protein D6785_06135 [Planctomycetota bacterium]|nr:MAG: hypothetical protein D6785_06135 [Planctomycetota bacterium]
MIKGESFFNKAIERQGKSKKLYFLRGLTRFYQGKFQQAIQDFESSITEHWFLEPFLFLGLIKGLYLQHYTEGLLYFEEALKSLFQWPKAYFKNKIRSVKRLLFFYSFYLQFTPTFFKGKIKKDIHIWQHHQKLFQELPQRIRNRFQLDFQDFIKILKDLGSFRFSGWLEDPIFKGLFFFYMAKSLQNSGNSYFAWISGNLAISLEPKNGYFYYWFGQYYYGRLERMIRQESLKIPLDLFEILRSILLSYGKAIEIKPELAYVIYPHLQKFQQMKKMKFFFALITGKLLPELKKIIHKYPNYSFPYFAMAMFYFLQGNFSQTEKYIQKGVALNPRFKVFGYAVLGKLYHQKGKRKEAIHLLKESIQAYHQFYNPTKIYGISGIWLAMVYKDLGEWDKGRDVLQKVLTTSLDRQILQKDKELQEYWDRYPDLLSSK